MDTSTNRLLLKRRVYTDIANLEWLEEFRHLSRFEGKISRKEKDEGEGVHVVLYNYKNSAW